MVANVPSDSFRRLRQEAARFGCPELVALTGSPTAEQLDYLDLMPGRNEAGLLPDAVAEFQGRPILYLVNALSDQTDTAPSNSQVRHLSQLLANRSEHAAIGVVQPGDLTLYPVNLDGAAFDAAHPVLVPRNASEAPFLFQRLATGSLAIAGQPTSPDYVFDEIHDLLTNADQDLAGQMTPLEVLSLTGRALFFRFLYDRRIVVHGELDDICPKAKDLKDVFSDAERAAVTSCWLDETFNGDLLPLVDGLDTTVSPIVRLRAYRKFFREASNKTNGKLFRHLDAIMRGWKHVGDSTFQTTIDWDDLDFAHIPIGVLSQVYETFSRRWDEARAEEASVYYTPKGIARFVVDEALSGVKEPCDALVLDPACGAGAFLVLAFRHLVRLRWEREARRPDKNAIQGILYKQIRGFDVSESALRLAALALYITAIEVNGTTRPPKILKFPWPLKDEVLFNFGPANAEERRHSFVLGSIAPPSPERFDAKFDVVLGNPPWTRLRAAGKSRKEKADQRARNDAINRQFTAITRRVLSARKVEGFDVDSYENPDNNPDLPFLWRAAEWAKPGGVIAMTLPARIILKQSAPGKQAREAVLRGLTVTGILNGSDLEKTAVWRHMDLPFMALFARNCPSPADHQFQFLTPIREERLSSRGEFRIDHRSAHAVSVESAIEKPWLLKALSVGSVLDVEVWDKVAAQGLPTIADIWTESALHSGEGYNVSPALRQRPADHLLDLPDFDPSACEFKIEFRKLRSWHKNHGRTTAHFPREPSLYTPPLVIVPQTPGETRDRPKAYLSERRKIAFSKSFYGYSTSGSDNAVGLARLLYLVMHSLIWPHYFLTHSSRIGASYRTILKEELESLPLPRVTDLTTAQLRQVDSLFERLLDARSKPWKEIDDFVFGLYQLSSHDATTIQDTVRFGAPYRSARTPAQHTATQLDVDKFCKYLEQMLRPYIRNGSREFSARAMAMSARASSDPWRFIALKVGESPTGVPTELLSIAIQEANRTAASRITIVLPTNGVIIGLLNQLRFWSPSRARLCGLHIVRQHLSAF